MYLNGKCFFVSAYMLFEKHGVENCKIELIETFPCSSKSELESREGHHQPRNECVNKNVARRSPKQYRRDNMVKKRIYNKHYYNASQDTIKTNTREYRQKTLKRVKKGIESDMKTKEKQ